MRVYSEIPELVEKTSVALGFFDGVHIAHREVIMAAVEAAKEGLTPAVLTFSLEKSAPKSKLNIKTILTPQQKLAELEKLGVEIVISPCFDDIDLIEATEFFEKILIKKLKAGFISCGYDYRFGNGARGDVKLLEELCKKQGVKLNVTKKLEQNGHTVSSTLLRDALSGGDIKTVNALLGYSYYMESMVEHGKKIGSSIGFPTINQAIPEACIVPKYGVYKTKTQIGNSEYKSLTNVGIKPTITGERRPLSETYILDFSGDIYGSTIKVTFLDFLREEIKFNSIEELKEQIKNDIERVAFNEIM